MPPAAPPTEQDIHGTWKLVSSTRKVLETGEELDTYGPNPVGYVTYSPDGRMLALIVRGDRMKGASIEALSDQERSDLFTSMMAYGGTYKFHGDRIEHFIDISWNEIWSGTTVVRDVRTEGDRLIYTTKPAPFSGDGKMSIGTLVWEKVK